MTSMIQIQDEYIAKVLGCYSGHDRRVRCRAARKAKAKLIKLGYTEDQAKLIIRDAHDMVRLEQNATEE